jgi:hypothetical protein
MAMTTPTRRFAGLRVMPAACALWIAAVGLKVSPHAAVAQDSRPARTVAADHAGSRFLTSHDCLACHNGLTTSDGEDVSIGVAWRASIMANSGRDPYWQAGVRREAIDHPLAAGAIEDECATCHMPMSRHVAAIGGQRGRVFAHLPIDPRRSGDDRLAADGVSCTVCHQIGPERLGSRDSFSGGFVIAGPTAAGERRMFGPFEIDPGRRSVMRSSTGMTPSDGPHIRQSELCATCHTLYTRALDAQGKVVGELPEQVPFLEWQHSAFRREQSCQSCHMPAVAAPTRIASVLGEPREAMGRHTFLGGNFFMLRMLNRYRDALAVEALPQELSAAADATVAQLQQRTAAMSIVRMASAGSQLQADIQVGNLTGHKLPTGYPSRRAWLRVTVRDRHDRRVFSSGDIDPSGLIHGNDNDADASRAEPHYAEIRRPDEVQIYESIMQDADGRVTTGLLRATAFAKDNRLLPRGFDKATAAPDIAVVGTARADADFIGGGDQVRYSIDTTGYEGPFRIDAELRFQPIAFRWAQNLRQYDATETRRFVAWFDAMASGSSVVLAASSATAPN